MTLTLVSRNFFNFFNQKRIMEFQPKNKVSIFFNFCHSQIVINNRRV